MYNLKINDQFPIGANKGIPISLIYKYCPEYIEWFIKNDNFYFYFENISEFENLPEPTPFYTDEAISDYVNRLIKKSPDLNIESIYKFPRVDLAIKFIEEHKILPKKFSEQIISATKKINSVRQELNFLLLELHQLDPINNKKPELIENSNFSNPKFSFSEEAIKINANKKWVAEEESKQEEDNDFYRNQRDHEKGFANDGWDSAMENDSSNYWNID